MKNRAHNLVSPIQSKNLLKYIFDLERKDFSSLIFGKELPLLGFDDILQLIENGNSLLRWGDGETANLRGKSTWHQVGDPILSQDLMSLLLNLPCLVNIVFGIPKNAIEGSLFSARQWPISKLRILLSTRILFLTKTTKPILTSVLTDACIFYENFPRIEEVIKVMDLKNRDVLLISSIASNKLQSWCGSFRQIVIPKRNAYSQINAVRKELVDWFSTSKHNPLLILAGGSMAKCLGIEHLSLCQVVDLGFGLHLFETGSMVPDWNQ